MAVLFPTIYEPLEGVAMSETEAPEDVEATETQEVEEAPAEEVETFDEDRAKAKIAKANSEAANLRKRLKELEPLAAKAKELEDANKSELEKLTESSKGHESRADKAETSLRKLTVALDKAPEGATIAQVRTVAKRLTGDSDEELGDDATELYDLLGAAKKTPLDTKPKEKLRGGGEPGEEAIEMDPRKLAGNLRRGR